MFSSARLTRLYAQCLSLLESSLPLGKRNISWSIVKNQMDIVVDKRFEKVKAQNFGPVLIRDSSNSNGELKSTFDYVKREHLVYDGIPYHRLPIARISARWNNTIINMLDSAGNKKYGKVSCRDAGFFNAKKKTELAGEVTGSTAATKALQKSCPQHVRVVVKGIGPGRKPSIAGLIKGGLKVVSISDITPLTRDRLPQRPRKIRRV